MQAIHAPLIRQSGITHVLHVSSFSSRERASVVVAGGQRVRVYEVLDHSTHDNPIGTTDNSKQKQAGRLRKVYDQVWGGDVTGLASVRTVASGVDGRERVVVGFGGKVSSLCISVVRGILGRGRVADVRCESSGVSSSTSNPMAGKRCAVRRRHEMHSFPTEECVRRAAGADPFFSSHRIHGLER